MVTSGSASVRVVDIGNKTMFGKIGLSLKEIIVVKTPLQHQISSFVKIMVWIGAIAFLIVVGYNYYISKDLVRSISPEKNYNKKLKTQTFLQECFLKQN